MKNRGFQNTNLMSEDTCYLLSELMEDYQK